MQMEKIRVEEKLSIIRKHQANAPVHVIPLAEALGVNVYYVDWPDDVSGRIERNSEQGGKSGYAIYINRNHHPNHRRFTIAHEIAHFILMPWHLLSPTMHEDYTAESLAEQFQVSKSAMSIRLGVPYERL